jgi:two-component system response regulator FixJ
MLASPAPEWKTSTTPTVFIVDDEADIRQAVSLMVRTVGLAEEAYATAEDFLDHFDPQRAGCLVLDIRLPGMSGLELQQTLNSNVLFPPIIFLTAYGEVPLAVQAIRAGAVDLIQKPFTAQALLERVHEAIRLDLDRRRKRALADEVEERIARLTDREREIMPFLTRGDSTKHIAQHLSLSPKTIDNHKAKILEKMQVDNATQLAHFLANLTR